MPPRPVAIVTGVSRRAGIGAAVAVKLAAAGWDVSATGWRPYDLSMPWESAAGDLQSIADEVEGLGRRFVLTEADLAEADAPASLLERTEQALGPATALVVVHTHDSGGGALDVSAADIDRHLTVNVRATLLLIAEFARRFTGGTGEGRIVTFSSGLPLTGSIAYAASKGAIEWLTVSAASELAPHITVNAVNPGPNNTGWMDDTVMADVHRQSPMGRVGRPDDAADLVAFLCSDAGGWITGQVLTSDGGWSRLRP